MATEGEAVWEPEFRPSSCSFIYPFIHWVYAMTSIILGSQDTAVNKNMSSCMLLTMSDGDKCYKTLIQDQWGMRVEWGCSFK